MTRVTYLLTYLLATRIKFYMMCSGTVDSELHHDAAAAAAAAAAVIDLPTSQSANTARSLLATSAKLH